MPVYMKEQPFFDLLVLLMCWILRRSCEHKLAHVTILIPESLLENQYNAINSYQTPYFNLSQCLLMA